MASSKKRKYERGDPESEDVTNKPTDGTDPPPPSPSSQSASGCTVNGNGAQHTAYTETLLKLCREITQSDLEEMKFRVRDLERIGRADIEKYSSSLGLIELLEERGYISTNNTTILRDLLKGKGHILSILATYDRGEDYNTEDVINKIQKELRQTYWDRLPKLHPFPWCPWREIDLDHMYTNLRAIPGLKHHLSITSQKAAPACFNASSTSHRSDEKQSPCSPEDQFNCVEDVVDFLWKDPNHKVAFLQGGTGIGKSTFCRRLVQLWAENKLVIPEREFDLVIFLEGRNFSGDLKHYIFQELFPHDVLDEDTVYNCIHKYAGNCLLIIDGVDELSDQGKTTTLHLAGGKLLRGVTLLLTGRTEGTKDFMQYVHKHLEVQGFTSDNAESYVGKYFGSGHPEKKDKVLARIRLDRDIRDLISPFTTLKLCLIAEHSDGEIPSEMDEILKEVTNAIMRKPSVSNLAFHDENEDKRSGNVTNGHFGRFL